jgi:REP element-mobilizing transposase RayT
MYTPEVRVCQGPRLGKIVRVIVREQGTTATKTNRQRLAFRGDSKRCAIGAALADEESLPRRFWQARFFDFDVWSREKQREKLGYMHGNPVKNGLVNDAKDWPWSSFSFYATGEPGLVRIDPAR